VTFNGIPAPLYYVTPGQLGVQVPDGVMGSVPVVVTSNNEVSAAFNAMVVSNAPSFFMWVSGGEFYPAAVMLDGTLIGDPATGVRCDKVRPGDIVMFFVNGIAPSPSGTIIPSPIAYTGNVAVNIGSIASIPSYTGLVAAGQYQMNFTIPMGLAPGDYPITITVEGQSSPTLVTLPVKQ
jgi:uncharacterized protein (TIGR03437 family)